MNKNSQAILKMNTNKSNLFEVLQIQHKYWANGDSAQMTESL